MPHRFILYDALKSLNKGHTLVLASEFSFLQHLEHCPEVHVISEMLIENGWVRPLDEDETRFEITPRGRAVFEKGDQQYKQFSLLKRLLARPLLLSW